MNPNIARVIRIVALVAIVAVTFAIPIAIVVGSYR